MCRLAAYTGIEITLSEFLLDQEHSLVKQAWAPKEMQDGTLNADGFGISWLAKDGTPCSYKNCLPIWSDTNLEGLGRSLESALWLANVRSATPGQGISEANTQPFFKHNLMFTHNGCFKPFNTEIKTELLDSIDNKNQAEITGDSDSHFLFAMLKQQLVQETDIMNAIQKMMIDIDKVCSSARSVLLNLIITDGDTLTACRHAINADCPSLYYAISSKGNWIASEPLTQDMEWHGVPVHTLINIDRSGNVTQFQL